MGTKSEALSSRFYEDFEPSFRWERKEDIDTLTVELPDFQKEQLRVQLTGFGNIVLSGERPLGDNRWSRFSREFPLPVNCDASKIRAKFEYGELKVFLPKIIDVAVQQSGAKPTRQAPSRQEAGKAALTTKEEKKTEKEKEKKQEKPTPDAPLTAKVDKTPEKKQEKESSTKPAELRSKFENYKQAVGGAVVGLKRQESRRALIVNLVVAGLVFVGLGVYLAYKMRTKKDKN